MRSANPFECASLGEEFVWTNDHRLANSLKAYESNWTVVSVEDLWASVRPKQLAEVRYGTDVGARSAHRLHERIIAIVVNYQ